MRRRTRTPARSTAIAGSPTTIKRTRSARPGDWTKQESDAATLRSGKRAFRADGGAGTDVLRVRRRQRRLRLWTGFRRPPRGRPGLAAVCLRRRRHVPDDAAARRGLEVGDGLERRISRPPEPGAAASARSGRSPPGSRASCLAASKGSTTLRNVPDVSLNADPDTALCHLHRAASGHVYGGVSCASPLWASFTALVNQQRAANGLAPLGQVTPVLYPLLATARYAQDFHDIADGRTNLYYPAVTGYDDATGLGSFNGANLLTDLTGVPQTGNPPPRRPSPRTPPA